MATAAHIIHKEAILSVPYYSESAYGIPVHYEKTLAFLYEFLKRVFLLSMNSYLKRILLDGEFYKAQNSQDYSDSYNGCIRLQERIDGLFAELSQSGATALEMERINQEAIPVGLRLKKQKVLLKQVDKRVMEIINQAEEDFQLLIHVMSGVLFGEKGGRFDTLSNIGYIGGKDNQAFIRKLKEILDGLNLFYQTLKDLRENEEHEFT